MNRARSSRQRYRLFVEDYRHRLLDEKAEAENQRRLDDAEEAAAEMAGPEARSRRRRKRRAYMREYLRWLWPHRYAAAVLLALALVGACLQMADPLFMRFIVDQV